MNSEPSTAAAGAPGPPTFDRLFATELPFVWATLRRLGVPAGDVEDVAHEVFLRVHGKLGHYDPSRPVRPWLFAFAVHAASDYRRLARHRVEVLGTEHDGPSDRPGPDSQLAARDDAELVDRALACVELDKRAVLVAYELDEIPMKDIAEALSILVNTAYSRLRLGREEFAIAVRRLQAQRGAS